MYRQAAPDPDLDLIQRQVAHSRKFFVNAQYFIGAVGAFVAIVSAARGLLWLAGFGLVFFGGLVLLMIRAERRYQHNPVLEALARSPADVTKVRHIATSDSRRMFVTHWVQVFVADQTKPLGFRVDEQQVAAFAELLARRCPNADVDVPGFERRT